MILNQDIIQVGALTMMWNKLYLAMKMMIKIMLENQIKTIDQISQ